MSNGAHDPWTRWFAGTAAALLALLFVLIVVATVRGPTTTERLQNIEDQLEFQTCLILLPVEEREARGVAECAAQPTEETP